MIMEVQMSRLIIALREVELGWWDTGELGQVRSERKVVLFWLKCDGSG